LVCSPKANQKTITEVRHYQLDNRFAGSIALADDTLLACIERLWTAKLRTLCLGPFRFTKLPGGERFVLGDASQIIGAESQDWIAQFR
jgi:hypothetical protein